MEITLEQAEKEFVLNRKHGKIHIKKYIGGSGNVTIPEFIDGMPVTKIEKMAFFGCIRRRAGAICTDFQSHSAAL